MTTRSVSAVEMFCRNVSRADGRAPVTPSNNETGRYRGFRTKSTRLPSWDYAGNAMYFVTLCTRNREHWLSRVVEGQIELTRAGRIVEEEWLRTEALRSYIELDSYVVMPNHVHAIVAFRDRHPRIREVDSPRPAVETFQQNVSTAGRPRLVAGSLGAVIGQFKSECVKRVRGFEPAFGWQANYYEHIVRDEDDLNRIREYIILNPSKWDIAEDVPENLWM